MISNQGKRMLILIPLTWMQINIVVSVILEKQSQLQIWISTKYDMDRD